MLTDEHRDRIIETFKPLIIIYLQSDVLRGIKDESLNKLIKTLSWNDEELERRLRDIVWWNS